MPRTARAPRRGVAVLLAALALIGPAALLGGCARPAEDDPVSGSAPAATAPSLAPAAQVSPAATAAAGDLAPSPGRTTTNGTATNGTATNGTAAGGATAAGTAGPRSQSTGRGAVDTAVENALPGTAGWMSTVQPRSGVAGFAARWSVTAGEPLPLYVSTRAGDYRVQVLRLGWYGGVGARTVWTSSALPGRRQPAAVTDPATNMVSAPWTLSTRLPTDDLPAGAYVAKLLAGDGSSSFVPFVIREQVTDHALLMVNSVATWQAYNDWGGANSYESDEGDSAEAHEHRSVVSSFDRPYRRGNGSGGLIPEELGLIMAAEKAGLKLNYAADLDLHDRPELLDGATGVALLGHSEYWSRAMREALTTARDRGVNIAFFGANAVDRRIRLEDSPLGPRRRQVNYKDGAADPVKTADTTADWRAQPYASPQSSLTGVQYRCAHARADLVITEPNSWLFTGLGVSRGTRLAGMVGSEFDRVVLGVPTPRPLQVMAHSPVDCYGYPEWSDLTWYTTPSGAGVFSAGTLDWGAGLTSTDPFVKRVVSAVTERVYRAVAAPAAGRAIPSQDNVARYYNAAGAALDDAGKPIPLPRPKAAARSATRS